MFTDDQDIERELTTALNLAPSGDFEARVLRRIEEDRRPRLAMPGWLAVAAALLVAAGAWFIATRESAAPPPVVTVTDIRSDRRPPARTPGVLPPAPQVVEPEAVRSAPRRPRSRPVTALDVASREPEVIVPAGQLALIRRWLRQANAGRVEVPDETATPSEPVELVIPPVVVEPIAVAGAEPGGGASRGPKGLQ